MMTITAADAMNALRTAVSRRGASYVYPHHEPVYVTRQANGDLQPECIVAAAFACLGIPLNLLTREANGGIIDTIDRLGGHLRRNGYLVHQAALDTLRVAQVMQDRAAGANNPGYYPKPTWGQALAAAENHHHRWLEANTAPAAQKGAHNGTEAAIHAAVDQLVAHAEQAALVAA